jgi:glyoxylase-like metal-dependent hydrolase (beta-lactamase superfamily II)
MDKTIKLSAIKYGETYINEKMAYQGGDESVTVPISLIIYLIEIDNKRILVDAGCESMPGFVLSHFCSPAEILRRAGVETSEITDVILTHAHYDHAEATRLYQNATVYIEEGEFSAAKRFFTDGMQIEVFKDETTLGNAVTVRKIGGHSKGSCVVELDYKGKIYVICGDECYVRRCLDEQIPTGSSVCPENSLAFVKKYGNGDYVTLLCHDVEILNGQNGVLEL